MGIVPSCYATFRGSPIYAFRHNAKGEGERIKLAHLLIF
jgi:hypothetical protein